MNADMNTASINDPEIGFEHVLAFKTYKETMDEHGEINKNTIKRRVQITSTGRKGVLHKYQIFLIETACIFDYKQEPSNVLIRRLTYVLDECFIGVTQNGTIAEVFNAPFIQYRWKQICSKLMQEHQGEIFEQYIQEMNNHVKDSDSILNYLQQLSMYGLYFNGYWNNGIQDNYFSDKELNIEGQNYLFKENVNAFNVSSEQSKGLVLEVTGNSMVDAKKIRINGKYQYINGILSKAENTLVTGSTKIKHTASWAGLRKRLQ